MLRSLGYESNFVNEIFIWSFCFEVLGGINACICLARGIFSPVSLLARDGGACTSRLCLVAEKGDPQTPLFYATDTWSGRVGETKYKRRDTNNKMAKRANAMQGAKCGKCEMRI